MLVRLAATVAASAMLAGCSLFGASDVETPDYEVMERLGEDLEVRRYGPRVAAEAAVPAGAGSDGRSRAFQLLFDYIKGANAGSREVAMTAPVETGSRGQEIAMTAPVETGTRSGGQDGEAGDGTVMRFLLPAKFDLDSAPEPTHQRVRLVEVPEETLAVLRFAGFGGPETVRTKKRTLMRRLKDSAWQATGTPIAMFYNPPWTLPFFRRNEVAVPVQRR
jgi:hypothetical protein